LRRAIQKNVESPLSVELLGGKYREGGTIQVDVDEEKNKIVFKTSEPVSKKSKQPADA
jgi:ATP-dependent Clp protease ATP-binding subunit ClpC